MRHTVTVLLALTSLVAVRVSAAAGDACGPGLKLCGSDAPCCSEFGYCGVGTFCLGGCNPLWSKTPQSCAPAPLCLPNTYTFNDLSRVQMNSTKYNGNATAYDWVVDKGELTTTGQEAVLKLTETNGGTRISSTRYVHYGTVTARLKTSSALGVVTAFITMSDVKDELDVEMPGASKDGYQSNLFNMGVANYSSGHAGSFYNLINDSYDEYHDYTIDWQPDKITWSIDGTVQKTTYKTDTLSSDGLAYEFPSTPSRVQLSIWPAGIESSAQGTIDWAGGMIDWTTSEYTSNGFHRVMLESVAITCSPTQASLINSTSQSYVYAMSNDTHNVPYVTVSTLSTIIGGASLRYSDISFTGVALGAVALALAL